MANTETTSTAAKAWAPDGIAYAPEDVVPDALVLVTSTVAGSIEGDNPSIRVAYADDAAAGFVAEGAPIDEADPGLSEVLIHTGKLAQLVRLSREQYSQNRTPQMLAASVRRALTRAANSAYIGQAVPTAPAVTPPPGLLNVAGLEVPPGATPAAVAGNLDVLVDLIAALQGNDAQPSHILLAPDAWAELVKMKTDSTSSNASLIGAGTDAAELRLLGLPVIVSNAVTTMSGLVIDRSAIVSAVGQVHIDTDESVYFTSDSVAIRATWRIGAAVVHPDRIGAFTVAAPVA